MRNYVKAGIAGAFSVVMGAFTLKDVNRVDATREIVYHSVFRDSNASLMKKSDLNERMDDAENIVSGIMIGETVRVCIDGAFAGVLGASSLYWATRKE
jgi:hypothetical protein